MNLFILNKDSKTIYLSKEKWLHIVNEHPALSGKIENLKEAIVNPSAIRKSMYNENLIFYYKYYKNIKIRAKYLIVIVKYLNGKGFIVTSYYVNKIKNEK